MFSQQRLSQYASEHRAMAQFTGSAYAESPLPYVRKRTQAVTAAGLPNTNHGGTIL
jgi:hypothetical protein